MAFLSHRTSKGYKYWSICVSKRVNGKPRNIPVCYLGTADSLYKKLNEHENLKIKSFAHGHVNSLMNIASSLDIVNIIDKYIPKNMKNEIHTRDGLTVGSSLLLAAIGRACHPTSKMAWYDWCQNTSFEFLLKTNLKKLDSQHFWDQMNIVPIDAIKNIEKEIVQNIIKQNDFKLDTLLYDTTNFFTFIDSQNGRCNIPQRGKNKQKRTDLRQIGMALAVTREDQIPLFHKTYQGNKNDITSFSEVFDDLFSRLKDVAKELTDITLVFDKGNNSKENFKKIDNKKELYYVGGLVSSYFKDIIKEANQNFQTIKIDDEELPCYRLKKEIWGKERTLVVTVSNQLKEGQMQGINQHLAKKYKELTKLKQQLENSKKRKKYSEKELTFKLEKIIKGQFIEDILKFEIIKLDKDDVSFTFFVDNDALDYLVENILGRQILVTNRHDWKSEEIIHAYKGQSKVEYTFRNLKNPYHLAIRPQYHWTDQKIEVHMLICLIGYMLSSVAYSKARKMIAYKNNMNNFITELSKIRLCFIISTDKKKVLYQLEDLTDRQKKLVDLFKITPDLQKSKIIS